ncbi:GNAT family N-acetyltransferase [Durusdinium trenchii]|uniref:GNAT family N-acetyltransferase n=1 Tax=Durusdinium trenchii TaxID=1381693 RepID=A0ABP0LJS8_9DINO
MAIALLSVGLLAVLVFLLGANVSRERQSVAVTQHEAEADPKSSLRKAIRAHGNCIEYVPMLSLMILALGLRLPLLPWWIAALMLGVFDNPINARSAKAFLADGNHMLVVAMDEERDNLVVGFASGVKMLHPDKDAPELFINEVGVAPAYQRRGVATAIMQALFTAAKKARCRIGWLAVDEDNDGALAFYKALGGKPPERQIHIDFELT